MVIRMQQTEGTRVDTEETIALPAEASAALAFWKSLRGSRALPCRSAFRPFEWRAWMSDISIIELHEGDNRYFVSLHGGGTQEKIGVNLHKRYMEDNLDRHARSLALDPYREAERTGLPTFSTLTPMLYPGVFHAFPRLVLPFTDGTSSEGPQRIDRFVTWIGNAPKKRYGVEELCHAQRMDRHRATEIRERVGLTVLPA